MKLSAPHPLARGIATVLAVAGTLCVRGVEVTALVWLALLWPMLFFGGVWRQHARFVLAVVLPICLALLFVWGFLVGAPPGDAVGSSPRNGYHFAALVALRLAVLGGIMQLSLLTIASEDLAQTLTGWGVRGEGLVIVIGAFALLPELRLRADQVLTARYARGFVRKSTMLNRGRQFPHLLRPLFAWALRSAIQRAELWEQRGLVARLQGDCGERRRYSLGSSAFFLTCGVGWCVFGILNVTAWR